MTDVNPASSGELIFYLIFGGGFLLAGLQAVLTGQMKVIQRSWEKPRYLEGSPAVWMGAIYLTWGVFLGVIAFQLLNNQHPTLYESAIRLLNLQQGAGSDAAVAILLIFNFTLVLLPAILASLLSRE